MLQTKIVDILLIEDSPTDIELTVRALKKNHISNEIHVISDGAEALEYIFGSETKARMNNNPKVIILDLKLPKVDGLEILKRLKGDENTKIIPVVVMTSSKEERDIVESYKLGVNSYIVKPVDFDKFVNSVNELGMYWVLLNEAPN
ncbi:MAG: response regulator [Bacteroidetes bacterium]|nr:response regulator [Bacteroidota bacterium]